MLVCVGVLCFVVYDMWCVGVGWCVLSCFDLIGCALLYRVLFHVVVWCVVLCVVCLCYMLWHAGR